MDLPRRYPYNPQWRLIAMSVAVSAAVLALVAIRWASSWIGMASCGAIPLALALLLIVRRLVFPRFLELGQDALLVPSGFLRARIRKIPYADMESGGETVRPGMLTFSLHAKGRTSEIVSNFFADIDSYRAVRDFVRSHVEVNRKAQPRRQRQPGEGIQYCLHLPYSGSGAIYGADDEILWRTKSVHPTKPYKFPPPRFCPLPDFAVYQADGREIFRFKTERRLPRVRFVMLENGQPICTIRQRSLLFTKYTLEFAGSPKWTVHVPLFTVFFRGESESGSKVRVRLRQHTQWYALIDEGADSPQLVAALAFIHRERLRHG